MDRTRRNALSITTTRKTDLSVRVSRFLNLLDCTTDDDDGDEDDRVSQRPYHRSAAINTQQWTGTNKLKAFLDVDARSVATLYSPTASRALITELTIRGRHIEHRCAKANLTPVIATLNPLNDSVCGIVIYFYIILILKRKTEYSDYIFVWNNRFRILILFMDLF